MRAPRLTEGVNLTSLDFTPFEGFILSRFDGVATLQDVADSTGASLEMVEDVARRLEAAGALEWNEGSEARRTDSNPVRVRGVSGEQPRPRPDSEKKERASRPSLTPGRGLVRTKPAPPDVPRQLYDPVELEEPDVDLDPDRRREILDTFYELDHLDHYELLGLEREADKQAIREAYFRLSKLFHPDTLYGKRLGTYKTKMEAVFHRLTDAYEVLGKAKKRARYDDYLKAKDISERARRGLAAGEALASKVEKRARAAVAAAVVEPSVPSTPKPPPPVVEVSEPFVPPAPAKPASSPPPTKPTSAPPPAEPIRASSAAVARPAMDEETRRQLARDLLQRRLQGATGRPVSRQSERPATPPTAPPPSTEPDKDSLLRGLASSLRHAARVTGGTDRAERHFQDAISAEKRGDLVGAVNALRLATGVAPDREDLALELERVRHLLAKQLAETYERQARYEEENGEYAAAARSWMKVAEGRPERHTYPMHAAMALLKANSDLRLAKDLAERAVELAPTQSRPRAVLAEVFLRAGMKANAKRELDAAAKLDPDADFVKNLQRELK
ncbi:MAG: J domain-containing protein [Sandaracinus sp.]|nr:J domain-containing protein [Sandaracinus sp.]